MKKKLNKPSVLIVIPARKGSKRLPGKNIKLLCGKPMISWTIEAAINARVADNIVVTTDDENILNLKSQYERLGVSFYERDSVLASDTASTSEVLEDVLVKLESKNKSFDIVVLLQPTSPLRSHKDITAALNLFFSKGRERTVVSVCKIDHPSQWVGNVNEKGELDINVEITQRSQDYSDEFRLNGAIYIARADWILKNLTLFTKKIIAFEMPRESSIDIDTLSDFEFAEHLLSKQ